jgi:SAM-dependent methyltransferase
VTSRGFLQPTRESYDAVAADYHELVVKDFPADPYHRALLGLFVDLATTTTPGGLIGDLGCGPGHVTDYLTKRGLNAFGIDLSPGMVEFARAEYPDLRFEVGSLFNLDLPDNHLADAVVWNALVHTPADELPVAFAEIYRVLTPGGLLAHSFKIGDGTSKHVDHAYGHDVSLNIYKYPPALVRQMLAETGFIEVATLLDQGERPHVYVLVRKPQ